MFINNARFCYLAFGQTNHRMLEKIFGWGKKKEERGKNDFLNGVRAAGLHANNGLYKATIGQSMGD